MAHLQRRKAYRRTHSLQIQRVNALQDRARILLQHAQLDFIDIAHAFAGIDETPVVLGLQGELEDATRHMGAEFFQQAVADGKGLIGALLLGDIQVNRQVPDP